MQQRREKVVILCINSALPSNMGGLLHCPLKVHSAGQIGAAGECQGPRMDQLLFEDKLLE